MNENKKKDQQNNKWKHEARELREKMIKWLSKVESNLIKMSNWE